MQFSTVHYSTLELRTLEFSVRPTLRPNNPSVQGGGGGFRQLWTTGVGYSTAQYSTVQYSTVQYSTVHYTTLHYTTLHYTTLQISSLQVSTWLRQRWTTVVGQVLLGLGSEMGRIPNANTAKHELLEFSILFSIALSVWSVKWTELILHSAVCSLLQCSIQCIVCSLMFTAVQCSFQARGYRTCFVVIKVQFEKWNAQEWSS